ncbi:MAG: hypothetical protein V3T82_08010 [Nitrospinaceae bacterium]
MDAIDEIRQEQIERIATLKTVRNLVGKARFKSILSDGMDIFNCGIDQVEKLLDELIEFVEQ